MSDAGETTDDPERYPVNAPGWAAIDRVVSAAYPSQTPHQFTSKTAYELQSTAPLPAISVFAGHGPAHWVYVTYGLSELFDKSSGYPEISGFGFELTFALPRETTDGQPGEPPTWPLALLHGIGGHVLSGHGTLDSGHLIDLGGPLAPQTDTALTGLLCVPDPRLGKVDTPHGSLLLMRLFGVTADEIEGMAQWSLQSKVGLLGEVAPQAITRLERNSLLADPATARAFRRAALGLKL